MENLINTLDRTRAQTLTIIETIDEASFGKRPVPERWSVAEVIHHLTIVDNTIIGGIKQKLEEPPQRLSLARRLTQPPLWLLVTNRFVRVKAPARAEPLNPPATKQETLDNFRRKREELKTLAREAGRARLNEIVLPHPFLGDYSGTQFVRFAGYHEQRHLKQIREIVKELSTQPT